ncbi:MAG: DUF924 family protein [Legionella sp.]|nr:DUF924 family protein [Legionella sp.]
MDFETILNFWFNQLTPEQWWKKDLEIDQFIIENFSLIHHQAISGRLFAWRKTARGCLAELIILDQFSRNMFRGTPRSFAYDSMALILSQEAIRKEFDQKLSISERSFLYMPFMHSESLEIHQQALMLFSAQGLEDALEFERQHFDIIKRFQRYPHRNKILGRSSTALEEQFLKQHEGF